MFMLKLRFSTYFIERKRKKNTKKYEYTTYLVLK